MKKIYILILSILYCLGNVRAQAPEWSWAIGMGSPLLDQVHDIVLDTAGNVYATGFFYGTFDFDPGPGVVSMTSAGMADIFVTKSDNSGNLIWARAMGGSVDDHGNSIALDASGNVYTCGYFQGIGDFDPGSGVFNLTPAAYRNIFISKLDNAGDFIWAKGMGGSGTDVANAMVIDDAGNIYTTGIFQDTVDFDPDAGEFKLATSLFGTDLFISKLSSSGSFVWAKQIGGSEGVNDYAEGLSITVDALQNVFTTGFFGGGADFDPGPGVLSLTSVGTENMFISKLNNSGNFEWAKQIGGAGYVEGLSIALDVAGNIYTTGFFEEAVDFDPDPSTSYTLTPKGYRDIFLSKLDNVGNFIWTKSTGGSGIDYGTSIALDVDANIYTTGFFQGIVDFDPGTGTFYLSPMGGDDVFVTKSDNDGNLIWAKEFGGAGNEDGLSVATDESAYAYIGGWYESPSIIVGSDTLLFSGSRDLFLARLSNVTGVSEPIHSYYFLNVFPNPAGQSFRIIFQNVINEGALTIYNMLGEAIFERSISHSSSEEITLEGFSQGIYLIKVDDGEKHFLTKAMVQY